jgi:hypothetical protein
LKAKGLKMLTLIIWSVYLFGAALTYLLAEWHMVAPPNPPTGRITRTWFFARFDKWMGLFEQDGTESKGYWDKKAYWLPLPCIGVRFERTDVSL